MLWSAGLLVLTLAATGSVATGQRPLLKEHRDSSASFDCRNAASRVEKLICGDVDLRNEDGNLDFLYSKLLRRSPASAHSSIIASQRAWLRVRNTCADAECLRGRYSDRESALWGQLDHWSRLLRRAVSRVGQCQVTTIEWIGPRLGNEPPTSHDRPDSSGTSVSFANGVDQVSYDLERPVARSHIGDRARVCLVSIPKHCPPGDDRGRFYNVTNLRTRENWTMPDSQHMCGGA
jgi:uncharacterized protein